MVEIWRGIPFNEAGKVCDWWIKEFMEKQMQELEKLEKEVKQQSEKQQSK